ncbi:DEAD/DEAH box helicase [Bacteriovoracales bacterium]|nr:DEAD/DEAH box helicase [Bacteriovoracales bacterium]
MLGKVSLNPLEKTLQFFEQKFFPEISAHQTLPSTEGSFSPFPENMHGDIQGILRETGIESLYSHQADAFQKIKNGDNTVIVSQTASGKTLSFWLPILDEYLKASYPFSVLLLYPTKALSRDQEGTLNKLMEGVVSERKLGTFDGDTPREERSLLQRSADFILTNPDMLHAGILPNHNRRWRNFLSRLKYIVIDEVHTYRGVYGSHTANVLRRLQRVCELHGSKPQFICSSATVGNPKEHVEALFQKPFSVVDMDGAPKPERDLYLTNPPLIKGHGDTYFRKGPASVAIPLIRKATLEGVRTICFCKARQQVERLYRAVTDGHHGLKDKVKPYRGGLLPNERRQLERDLFDGKITTIITTNALELGIDIGDLQLAILCGHPGTVASFWQQAGRVGRKGKRATIIFIGRNSPVDQYLVNNPEFITDAPIERAWLNADNPYIFLQHLPCMAQEYPLREEEPLCEPLLLQESKKVLLEEGTLKDVEGDLRYNGSHFPSRGVNLRGMTDYNIEIFHKGVVIGEIDPIGARGTLYKDAIYQHLGKRYMSLNLDLEKKLCEVGEVNVDYYTEAVWEGRVEMTDVLEKKDFLQFGDVYVNRQPKLFKKIRERSYENIGYGPITLDPFEYETTGLCLLPNEEWQKELDKVDKRLKAGSLYGLAYLLRRTAPGFCMGSTEDIQTDVSLTHENENWKSALYLYDAHEGGVGHSEKIYDLFSEALDLCQKIIDSCPCKWGCPSCVPPLPPGVQDEDLEQWLIETNTSLASTKSLLTNIKKGKIVIPKIETSKRKNEISLTPPPEAKELIKLQHRLGKAAKSLNKKREREH